MFLVGTEFFCATGGIQYVNRLLWKALERFAETTPSRIEVFAYGDGKEARLPAEYARAGFEWHAAGHRRGWLAARLAKRLVAAEPHLVLCTHVNLLALAPLVRWLAPGAAMAALGHGIEVWERLPKRILRELKACASVPAPSRYTRQRLMEVNGVPAEKAVVLHHGLAPDWELPVVAKLDPRSRKPTLLTVSRLSAADAYKGVDVLIEAMPRICELCPEARLRIVGDGADRARLERMAQERGVAARVTFLGELREEAVRREYEEAAVFVLPSKKEGFGIVYLEAMSYGLPVVAARAGGTLDVVEDGVTGILVPPDEPAQLASAVGGLLLLPEERAALGAAGRRRVEERFLFSHFAARWQRWIAEVAPVPVYLARHAAAFGAGHRGDEAALAAGAPVGSRARV
jgi:glycosyltransferase involved in cell wall biosynthesis